MATISTDGHQSESHRRPLTHKLTIALSKHLTKLDKSVLPSLTFETHDSSYANARHDLTIYNSEGQAIIDGREFDDGLVSFWFHQETYVPASERQKRLASSGDRQW